MSSKYEIRRNDRALTEAENWEFLAEQSIGRLGLVDGEGFPYVVPMHHVVIDEEIFFHCASKGRKLNILRTNPKACYEADADLGIKPAARACAFGAFFKSVLAFGEAYEVEDEEKKVAALNKLVEKHAPEGWQYEPVTKEDAGMLTVIGMRVHTLTGKARYPEQ